MGMQSSDGGCVIGRPHPSVEHDPGYQLGWQGVQRRNNWLGVTDVVQGPAPKPGGKGARGYSKRG
jgi:hypothetical protein